MITGSPKAAKETQMRRTFVFAAFLFGSLLSLAGAASVAHAEVVQDMS
jgi:hypothetical protein